jgi:hypothetical protein
MGCVQTIVINYYFHRHWDLDHYYRRLGHYSGLGHYYRRLGHYRLRHLGHYYRHCYLFMHFFTRLSFVIIQQTYRVVVKTFNLV